MNYGIILISSVILFTVVQSSAFALETTYPTINHRLTEIPTYCAVESISKKINSSDMDEMIKKSEDAVNDWKIKLQSSEPINKDFWEMKFKKISKSESVSDDCTIVILFRDDPEFSGSLLSKTLGAFMRNTIFVYYENQESVYGEKWMDGILKTVTHEIGHTFGLGHYTTDSDELNKKISKRDESPPSIMFTPAHVNPTLRTITEIDIKKVQSIYGSYGFHAFSETRPVGINIEDPIPPLDPAYPFEITEISEKNVTLFRHQDTLLTISGQINSIMFMQGHPVFVLITNPDLSTQVLKITPTKNGFFETYVNFSFQDLPGKYSIEFAYIGKIDESKNLVFDVEKTEIALPSISENQNIISINNDAERFFEMGLFSDAIKNYKIVIKNSERIQEPLHLNALNKIGLSLIELEDFEKSLPYFEQVYEINPAFPNIEKNLKNSKLLISSKGYLIPDDSLVSLPGWIKSNAGWWVKGQANDHVIFEAFEYMQAKGMIGNYEFSDYSEQHVPTWLKEITIWWIEDKITDNDFLKTIDYLSKQGIIII